MGFFKRPPDKPSKETLRRLLTFSWNNWFYRVFDAFFNGVGETRKTANLLISSGGIILSVGEWMLEGFVGQLPKLLLSIVGGLAASVTGAMFLISGGKTAKRAVAAERQRITSLEREVLSTLAEAVRRPRYLAVPECMKLSNAAATIAALRNKHTDDEKTKAAQDFITLWGLLTSAQRIQLLNGQEQKILEDLSQQEKKQVEGAEAKSPDGAKETQLAETISLLTRMGNNAAVLREFVSDLEFEWPHHHASKWQSTRTFIRGIASSVLISGLALYIAGGFTLSLAAGPVGVAVYFVCLVGAAVMTYTYGDWRADRDDSRMLVGRCQVARDEIAEAEHSYATSLEQLRDAAPGPSNGLKSVPTMVNMDAMDAKGSMNHSIVTAGLTAVVSKESPPLLTPVNGNAGKKQAREGLASSESESETAPLLNDGRTGLSEGEECEMQRGIMGPGVFGVASTRVVG